MTIFRLMKGLGTVIAAASCLMVAGCDNPAAMNESTANVKRVEQADFAEAVERAAGPVVVDFYATWCGTCRRLAPLMDRVAGNYAGKIKFVKVNVDESPKLAQEFQIEALPLVLLFKEGKPVEHITGLPAEADLKTKLDALITPR